MFLKSTIDRYAESLASPEKESFLAAIKAVNVFTRNGCLLVLGGDLKGVLDAANLSPHFDEIGKKWLFITPVDELQRAYEMLVSAKD